MSKPKDERALSHCDGCGEDLPAREVTEYFHKLKSATPPQLVDVRTSIHLCEDCAKNAEDYLGAIFESDEITDPKEWGALLSWLKDEQAEEPRDPRTLSALIELAGGPGAFILDNALSSVIALSPHCPVIVRTARAMFICSASDVPHLEQCLLAGGEAVRVVALLSLQEQNPIPTPPN